MENNFEKVGADPPLATEQHDFGTIQIENGGRLELIAQETTGTFTPEDEFELAKIGQIVLPVALGQNLYQYVKSEGVK